MNIERGGAPAAICCLADLAIAGCILALVGRAVGWIRIEAVVAVLNVIAGYLCR